MRKIRSFMAFNYTGRGESPNDPKLSECGGWRTACKAGWAKVVGWISRLCDSRSSSLQRMVRPGLVKASASERNPESPRRSFSPGPVSRPVRSEFRPRRGWGQKTTSSPAIFRADSQTCSSSPDRNRPEYQSCCRRQDASETYVDCLESVRISCGLGLFRFYYWEDGKKKGTNCWARDWKHACDIAREMGPTHKVCGGPPDDTEQEDERVYKYNE